MVEVLGELGYEVVTASDGEQGLRLAAAEPVPCLVLLDWRMPGIDGPIFLGRLRALPRGAEFPVILSTADIASRRTRWSAQVAGVLSKPFDLDALLEILERVTEDA